MPLLDRYLFRELTSNFFFALIGLLTFSLSIAWIDHLNRHNMPWGVIWGFFKYLIPENIVLMTIVALFMSCLVTFSSMAKSLELVAMSAGGISTLRIFSPAISLSFAISTAHLILNDQLAIQAKLKYIQVRHKAFYPDHTPDLNPVSFRMSNIWMKLNNRFYNFTSSSDDGKTISGVSVFEIGPQFEVLSTLAGPTANLTGGKWVFREGHQASFPSRDSLPVIQKVTDLVLPLELKPDEVKQVVPNTNAMKLSELKKYIEKNRASSVDDTAMSVEFHYRVAFSFACFIFCIVSLPFCSKSQRNQNIAVSIGICFFLIICYWFLFQTLKSMGTSKILPPVLAAWGANILFGSGALLFLRMRGAIR